MTKKIMKPFDIEEGGCRTMVIWMDEINDQLNEALEESYQKMLEDDDEDFLLKRSAVLLFLSRFHYVYHKRLIAAELELKES